MLSTLLFDREDRALVAEVLGEEEAKQIYEPKKSKIDQYADAFEAFEKGAVLVT